MLFIFVENTLETQGIQESFHVSGRLVAIKADQICDESGNMGSSLRILVSMCRHYY